MTRQEVCLIIITVLSFFMEFLLKQFKTILFLKVITVVLIDALGFILYAFACYMHIMMSTNHVTLKQTVVILFCIILHIFSLIHKLHISEYF